jgi:sulfur relay protein TusB/DsrH
MALHLLATFNSDSLRSCLASVGESDILLLLGDGVYLLQSVEILALCQAATSNLYVLSEDLQARIPEVKAVPRQINYAQWVDLTLTHNPVVSWY